MKTTRNTSMTKIFTIVVAIFINTHIFCQVREPEELNSIDWNDTSLHTTYQEFITDFFSQVDFSYLETDFFYGDVVPYSNLKVFNGDNQDTILDYNRFFQLYSELLLAQKNGNLLPDIQQLNQQVNSYIQQNNLVINGGFEGTNSGNNMLAPNWLKCYNIGNSSNNTPDIMPGVWNVNNPPFEGNHYLNMVCKDEALDRNELAIGQLSSSLDSGVCYKLSIKLAMSSQFYISNSWNGTSTFNLPVELKIGLRSWQCSGALDYLTSFIQSNFDQWDEFRYVFVADKNYSGVYLQTWYIDSIYPSYSITSPYDGHVLIDDFRITKVDGSQDTIVDTLVLNDSIQLPVNLNEDMYFMLDDSLLFWESPYIYYDSINITNNIVSGTVYDTTTCYKQNFKFILVLNEDGESEPLINDILQEQGFILPNIVTPNSDGVNDMIKFPIDSSYDFSYKIYNRWGMLLGVATPNKPFVNFDKFSEGTYFYIFSIENQIIKKGSILVVK